MKPAGATDNSPKQTHISKDGNTKVQGQKVSPRKVFQIQEWVLGSFQHHLTESGWAGIRPICSMTSTWPVVPRPSAAVCLSQQTRTATWPGEHLLQLLKWEEMRSLCRPPLPGHLTVLRLRLFFSLSVLWPGGSQNSGCFCL